MDFLDTKTGVLILANYQSGVKPVFKLFTETRSEYFITKYKTLRTMAIQNSRRSIFPTKMAISTPSLALEVMQNVCIIILNKGRKSESS